MGAVEVSAFLTSLAVHGQVAASTQDQTLSALPFLYRVRVRRQHERNLRHGAGWVELRCRR